MALGFPIFKHFRVARKDCENAFKDWIRRLKLCMSVEGGPFRMWRTN